jgi:hypothetical protein
VVVAEKKLVKKYFLFTFLLHSRNVAWLLQKKVGKEIFSFWFFCNTPREKQEKKLIFTLQTMVLLCAMLQN